MANQRIKGQEVTVSITVDGVPTVFSDINSFEMSSITETTEEGYLGDKANRYDEFYKGYTGSIKMHNGNGEVFKFQEAVKARAQRRTPASGQINVTATLDFPNGERSRVVLKDAFFDDMGIAFSSRDAYGETSMSFKGADFSIL